jgi:transposase
LDTLVWMTPEKLFHQMLGLADQWEVYECDFDGSAGLVRLAVRESKGFWSAYRCPHDQGEITCYDHTEELVWRHLNVFEHRCEIRCRLPRTKCRVCGKVERVTPPWEGLSKHFTRSFEAFALLLLREMPVATAGRILGESDTRLWRMLFAHVEAAYNPCDMSEVTCVGVDEMNLRKGREYLTIFADLKARKVLYATEGRDKQSWERFLAEWEKHEGHRHQLTTVSMDMSKPYQSAVHEWCRNAEIVFDKYHVIAHVNAAVDHVRKYELRFGSGYVRAQLKKTLWLWRKNPENLSPAEQERFKTIDQKWLWTAKAYQMRLVFQEIYRSATRQEAEKRFHVWCRWVRWVARDQPRQMFSPMLAAAKMVLRHLPGILAHWKEKITNAFMEGLNSVFSATKRRARGYTSSEYLIAILYLVAGKLRIPFH